MRLSENAEEMLEQLWIQIVECKKDGCEDAIFKDKAALDEIIKAGCVKLRAGEVNLTPSGKEEAKSCVRRHRLAERLFADVFDAKNKLIHEAGCKFEHMLHKGLDDKVCTLLGHPRACPHGSAIPEGKCCKELKRIPEKLIMPLTDLGPRKKAMVSYLQTQNRDMLQKILAIGVLPRTEIILVQKFPSFVFQIENTQFAVDKELASHIYVMQLD